MVYACSTPMNKLSCVTLSWFLNGLCLQYPEWTSSHVWLWADVRNGLYLQYLNEKLFCVTLSWCLNGLCLQNPSEQALMCDFELMFEWFMLAKPQGTSSHVWLWADVWMVHAYSTPLNKLSCVTLTFSQRHTSGLVLCFPSIANAALAS